MCSDSSKMEITSSFFMTNKTLGIFYIPLIFLSIYNTQKGNKMKRVSDLEPMLGYPGGICKVVERVDDKFEEGYIEQSIIDKVENAEDLDNLEASVVYPRIVEKPLEHNKIISEIELSSHAQYRMDLRGVTTGDIRVAFKNFVKQFYNEKSQNSSVYLQWEYLIGRGAELEYTDRKLGNLYLRFSIKKGRAILITTYFEGEKNPRPKTCKRADLQIRLASIKKRFNIS